MVCQRWCLESSFVYLRIVWESVRKQKKHCRWPGVKWRELARCIIGLLCTGVKEVGGFGCFQWLTTVQALKITRDWGRGYAGQKGSKGAVPGIIHHLTLSPAPRLFRCCSTSASSNRTASSINRCWLNRIVYKIASLATMK